MTRRPCVDGVVYETEHPAVYSTGTWSRGSGCGAKFAKSQRLHCNGEFTIPIKVPSQNVSTGGGTGQ